MKLQSNKNYKIIQKKVFTTDECKKILDCDVKPAEFTTYNHMRKLDLVKRNDDNKWIRDRIEKELLLINKRHFGYRDVYLQNDIGLRVYKKGESYIWHTDNFLGQRLSMSLLLDDDFDGGELGIFTGDFSMAKKQVGVMTVWQPFLFHAVDEVTRGERPVLLTFLQGPRFEL